MYLFRRVLHLLESLFHFIRFFVGSFFRPSTRTDRAYSPVLRDHLPMTFHDDATLADISSSLCCEPIVRTPRDCLHILAGQIAGDYVLHLEFVPSSVHLSHRCGLFVIVEPAGSVTL